MRPEMLALITRGRLDVDALNQMMKSPAQFLRHMDAEGVQRAVLVNYPSPDLLGFTERVNDYVAQYCQADPSRLIPMGGVHPRFTEDAAAAVRRAAELRRAPLKVHPPPWRWSPTRTCTAWTRCARSTRRRSG
jgi:predicted TIM-barrel fold metal-dependent hydrolase